MHVMTIQAATFAQRYQTAKTALGDMPDLVGVAYIGYNLPAQARERFYDRAGDPTAVEAATQWAFHSQIAPGRDWANLRTPAVTVMYLSKAYERMYRVSGN